MNLKIYPRFLNRCASLRRCVNQFLIFVILVFGIEEVLAESPIKKIGTNQTIEEISEKIKLHSGTYNLSIFGSMRFNDYLVSTKNKKNITAATIELVAPHWVSKIEKIDGNALIVFPIRILIVEADSGSVVSFYDLRNLLRSMGFKNKDLLKEADNIDSKFNYFLRTVLR